MKTKTPLKKIVIIGGGFAGLNAALGLKFFKAKITLIDKTNHHLFQPLLYQVATASLSPADIAVPLRGILHRQKNTTVIMGEVIKIDKDAKTVTTKLGQKFDFDYLVIATGARHSYFGNEAWESHAPGLKTLHDALTIREKVLLAFERAELLDDEREIKRLLTFVIVGGGPTGVEMAGAIAEISKHTLKNNFKQIKPALARVILIESSPAVLNRYPKSLSAEAQKNLEELGVECLVGNPVTHIEKGKVVVGDRTIEAHTLIWAAGNRAPKVLETLEVELEKNGQVIVNADLSLPGYPHIFVLGDSAKAVDKNNMPLPAVAPVAIQQGRFVAKLIKKEPWKTARPTFNYIDKGTMATIGRAKAVAYILNIHVKGFMAWVMWSCIHILFLIDFRSKVLVMMSWAWSYLNFFRGVRLIIKRNNDEPVI